MGRRRAWPLWIAGAGCLLVLPWAFLTLIEVDSGWEDAIWPGGTSRVLAIAFTVGGAAAAVTAVSAAIGYRSEGRQASLRLFLAALAAEALLGIAWIVLAMVS